MPPSTNRVTISTGGAFFAPLILFYIAQKRPVIQQPNFVTFSQIQLAIKFLTFHCSNYDHVTTAIPYLESSQQKNS